VLQQQLQLLLLLTAWHLTAVRWTGRTGRGARVVLVLGGQRAAVGRRRMQQRRLQQRQQWQQCVRGEVVVCLLRWRVCWLRSLLLLLPRRPARRPCTRHRSRRGGMRRTHTLKVGGLALLLLLLVVVVVVIVVVVCLEGYKRHTAYQSMHGVMGGASTCNGTCVSVCCAVACRGVLCM